MKYLKMWWAKLRQVKRYGRGNVEKIRNITSSEVFDLWEVIGTPFTIVRQSGKYCVLLGSYKMSESLETLDEAIEDSERADWDRYIQIAGAVAQTEYKSFNTTTK